MMNSYSIILGFLSAEEQTKLQEYIKGLVWESGRQETGYFKAAVAEDDFKDIKARSLTALGTDLKCKHDCYVLRYPAESRIPPHLDDAPFGAEHWRLNAVIQSPEIGGVFGIESRSIDLLEGDGVVFRPDKLRHRITTVYGNTERYVWSVGVLK